jgi:small-conductance mechanosensitive channel
MTAKVKINLQEGVIELEGSEDFVDRQVDKLEAIIELFNQSISEIEDYFLPDQGGAVQENDEATIATQENIPAHQGLSVSDSFGEWMHKFRDDINDQEKALIASFYVQAKSSTNDFKTIEVSNCLKDHGIKIANPSTNIKRLATKKLTFQTRKVGKLIYMRVSKDGEAHLKSMLR